MYVHVVCVGVKSFYEPFEFTHHQLSFQQSIYAGFYYYPVSLHYLC